MNQPVPLDVACSCGASVTVLTYTLVNVAEAPQLLGQIEKGEFHTGICSHCGKHIQVDKWFLFQNPRNEILVHVFPREYRHSYLQLQQQLAPLHRLCGIESDGAVSLVFGIDGLVALLRGEPSAPPVLFPNAIPNHSIRN